MKKNNICFVSLFLSALLLAGCANSNSASNGGGNKVIDNGVNDNQNTNNNNNQGNNQPGGNQGGFPGEGTGGDGPGTVKTGNEEVFVTEPDFDITSINEKISSLNDKIFNDESVKEYVEAEVTIVDLSLLTENYAIAASGTYVFRGESEYQVVVNNKGFTLNIYLENAKFDSLVAYKKPKSTVLTIVGNNELTGVKANNDTNAKGPLNIKGDVLINGSGSLKVTASGEDKNGIHVTGKLKILGPTITVIANKNGIKGNDALIIKDAKLDVTTLNNDGIKTENEQEAADYTEPDFSTAYMILDNADIKINAKDDGIFAATKLHIKGGRYDITTNGGVPSKVTEQSSDNANGKAVKAGVIDFIDASANVTEIENLNEYLIAIDGGEFKINSNDDAFHSNGSFLINGGKFDITTGDDGLHADELLRIDENADVRINMCYEGLEGAKVEVYSGTFDITAADDGINAADGSEKTVDVDNPNCWIRLYGGHFDINSGCNGGIDGDGIDSNGILLVDGAEIYVSGPVSGADGAMDSDGGIIVDSGLVCALGATGRDETIAANSKQPILLYTYPEDIAANTTLKVKDSNDNVLISYKAAKSSQMAFLSCADFEIGGTYRIFKEETELASVTLEKILTKTGTRTGGNNSNQPGQPNNPGQGGDNPGQQGGNNASITINEIPVFAKGADKIENIKVTYMNVDSTLTGTLRDGTSYVYDLSGKGGQDEDVTGTLTLNSNNTYEIFINGFGPFSNYQKNGSYSENNGQITITL